MNPALTNLSYSSIKDAKECPFRFKLRYIDKIYLWKNSIDTIYGNIIHECVQSFLMKERSQAESIAHFKRKWKKFCKIYRNYLDFEKIKRFYLAGCKVLQAMSAAFEGYDVLSAEEKLMEPINEKYPNINFKGYVDIVMEKNGRLIIVDLKTAKTVKSFKSYLDAVKKYQLTYYKQYYAKKHDIALDDIDVVFVVLEKDPDSNSPIAFIPDSSTPVKMKNANALLNKVLDMAEREDYPKNRAACYNEWTGIGCAFYKTRHCPADL